MPPRLSVIVLAYNRTQYLTTGVASALHQTLPRDQYEILVFKNFENEWIDSYLAAHGVRTLTSEPSARPRTMRTVLEEAKGDVLCFLDDDDLYLPEKLEAVDREFSRDPTLGYYHNGFQVVDEELRPFASAPFPQTRERLVIPAADPHTRSLPRNVLRLGYNTSSVSIRRGWLDPFLPYFETREAELSDAMDLTTALLSGWTFLADPRVLTQYRYHDSWTNVLQYTPESVGRVAEWDTLNLRLLDMIANLAVGTTLAPLVDEDRDYVRFHKSIFVEEETWRPRLSDVARFLASGVRQWYLAPFYLTPLHLLARYSHPSAQRTYFRLADVYRRYSFRRPAGS